MMRIDRRLILLTAAICGFALAGCCDSDKPLGVQEDTSTVPAAVVLGTGATFGVFANDSINSTGNTVITGDLGVSPGIVVTGSPTVVNGTIQAGTTAAATALVDLNAAIVDVAARTNNVDVSGNLGGLTLSPGVYTSTGPLTIDGDVTLNGLGNPNGVFIIRAPSLTVTPGSRVILMSSAQAKNVIWQVGTDAIIGANTVVEGTILAGQNVTVDTGAVINGSVVAQTGVVTLTDVTITVP